MDKGDIECTHIYIHVLNRVWLFVTPWTAACHDLLSKEFTRLEYWSGFSFPTQGGLSDRGIKPTSLASPALQADSLQLSHQGSRVCVCVCVCVCVSVCVYTNTHSRILFSHKRERRHLTVYNNMDGTLGYFSSVTQLCLILCNPMDCSMPGFPAHDKLLGLVQTHVHWISDAIQTSHPLSSPSPPAFSLSQHWGLFQRVSSSHQMAKVLEFQLQHWSFQWILRTDFL